jgi:hypothetical protein
MSIQRKRYSSEEKTKVAVEAMKGQKKINELPVNTVFIRPRSRNGRSRRWKKSTLVFLEAVSDVKERMKLWWRLYTKK